MVHGDIFSAQSGRLCWNIHGLFIIFVVFFFLRDQLWFVIGSSVLDSLYENRSRSVQDLVFFFNEKLFNVEQVEYIWSMETFLRLPQQIHCYNVEQVEYIWSIEAFWRFPKQRYILLKLNRCKYVEPNHVFLSGRLVGYCFVF